MFSFHNVKSKWHYLILLAILAKIIISYKPSYHVGDPDAESAIKRAKTDSCKKELEEFATRSLYQDNPPQLRRSCMLDSNKPRNLRIGCATNNTVGIIQLESLVANSSLCLDLCFSYGHSHGGYNGSCCFCGDTEEGFTSALQGESCIRGEEFDWYRVNNGIYHPIHSSTSQLTVSNRSSEVKIAFLLILSGRSILQIQRLIGSIYSEKHLYYIHVDRRNDYLLKELEALEDEYHNVIIAKSRFNTIWGGPSLLRMIIDAIGHLMNYQWDYLLNLSESDFPIKPLSMLENYLSLNINLIYLRSHNIKGYKFIKKQGLDRNFYQCEDRVWRMGNRHLPRGIVYSGGSDWFALPRDFCRYINSNLRNTNALVKPLMQLYNYTLLPVESFFHTLTLNSEFCDRYTDQNLRITNWNRKQGCKCQHTSVVDWCGCSPLVYRWSDWERLKRTNTSGNLFFSRKFDPTISSSIISAVEYELVRPHTASGIEYDTRYWQNVYEDKNAIEPPRGLDQFGLFALNQAQNLLMSKLHETPNLRSINLHFDKDRFIGLIYEYCDQLICAQLLIERNNTAHIDSFNAKCFTSNKRTLKVIEVNHGFDTGERMFRDYKPLNDMSDIVVYHEWVVKLSNKSDNRGNFDADQLKYSWWDPDNHLELIQNIKLKGAAKPTKLSLAHRLNIPKPMKSGIWTLTISQRNLNCLSYKFPIFDHSTFAESKISRKQFSKFYFVSKTCVVDNSNTTESNLHHCSNHHWSLATSIRTINI